MDEALKNFIRKSIPQLKEVTICDDHLLDKMVADSVITAVEKEEIDSKQTRDSKASVFYDTLIRKSRSAYTNAIEHFKTSGQETVARILEGGLSQQNHVQPKNDGPIWFDMGHVVGSFKGRTSELLELHKLMTKPTTTRAVINQITYIVGLGGIGKSELARKYAFDYWEYYCGNVIWINSENRESFRNSLVRLCKEFFPFIQAKSLPKQDLVKIVYDHFLTKNENFLIILDNVEEFDAVKMLPSYKPFNQNIPKVLITSRKAIRRSGMSVLTLDVLNDYDAVKLLEECLNEGQAKDRIDLKILAKLLQCLPLALQQASAYILTELNQNKNPIKTYTELLDSEKAAALLAFKNEELSAHEKTTLTTWTITLKSIETKVNGPLAIKIMNIVALMQPDDIPSDMIVCGLKPDCKCPLEPTDSDQSDADLDCCEDAVNKAIDLLKKYSMITGKVGVIHVHRLVQRVVQLTGNITCVMEQGLTFLKYLLANQNDSDDKNIFEFLHIESIWIHALRLDNDEIIRKFGDTGAAALIWLTRKHDLSEKVILDSITQLERVFGSTHEDVIRLKYILAISYYKHGKFENSLEILTKLKPFAAAALGAQHELTELINMWLD